MLARILGPVIVFIVFVLGAIFASVLLLLGAVALFGLWIYLRLKAGPGHRAATAEFRGRASGHTIEGEYKVEDESEKQRVIEQSDRPPQRDGGHHDPDKAGP